jgi:hypothetical protein
VSSRRVRTLVVALMIVYPMFSTESGEIKTGTIIVVINHPTKIALAADSRTVWLGKRDGYDDDACKISAPDKRVIIALAGLLKRDVASKQESWDPMEEASRISHETFTQPSPTDDPVSQIAHRWGDWR